MPKPDRDADDHGMSVLNRLYYRFKPLLPLKVRFALRRLRARYKLHGARNWPISESSAAAPAGWPGWPEGKRFAFVLTHDVEGQVGLDRCLQLAEVEREFGFRLSFNFIPEGEYRVSPAIRERLIAQGFEVGVHDLRHDGSLYRSRREFDGCAVSINRYLAEWGAVGFRAGFMFHNLEWLKALQVEYDASTFDTDPFEPQSDGVNTIFPFWVPRERPEDGYVELPYTLPQDSTLFLILQHRSAALWQRKLDWVAAHGGMALLNVHPDYVAFDRKKPGLSEFSPSHYADLLRHVRDHHAGTYWNAVPREVARYFRSTQGRPASGS